jgi:hypothetical protein
MEQSIGFESNGILVCQFKKSLNSFKQGPSVWYGNIVRFFLNLVFKCCGLDQNIYVLHVNDDVSLFHYMLMI